MGTLAHAGSSGHRRAARASLAVALALLTAIASVPSSAAAATVTNAWRAKLGTGGANGVATVQAYTSGTGSIVLRLARLRAATDLPVTLSKGTCGSVGTTLLKFPAIRSTSTGAAARTSSLTAAQVTLVKNATNGTGKIAIRVGSATTGGAKCGVFSVLVVPPYVAATITVGFYPFDVALTPTAVWVSNGANDSLSRIDPTTNTVLSAVTLGTAGSGVPLALATGDGALWVSVADFDPATNAALPGSVMRIDPAAGQVTATIPVGRDAVDLATSPGAVWVANYDDGTVSRIDTSTNAVVATITLAAGVVGVAYGEGAVWVSNEETGSVSRIDPATNQVVATITTVGTAGGVAVGPGAVWVVNEGNEGQGDGALSRIDPATNQVVATTPVGTAPIFVAVGGGSVWVAMARESTVVQVSASTNAVQARVHVVGRSWGIAATDHAVWTVQPNEAGASATPPQPGTVTRITY